MNASAFLDSLYEAVYRSLGHGLPGDKDLIASKSAKKLIQEVVGVHSTGVSEEQASLIRGYGEQVFDVVEGYVLSKYEDPWSIAALRLHADRMEAAARKAGMTLPERPLLGTLPHGDVNARTMLVPGTEEHLVLFESELFTFVNLVSKAIVEVMPLFEHDDGAVTFDFGVAAIEAHVESAPEVVERFVEIVMAYAAHGQASRARPYLQERRRSVFAQTLRDGMEFFVLGHEYGHISLKHLGERRAVTNLGPDLDEGSPPEELSYNWMQELQADACGLFMTVPSIKEDGYPLDLAYVGVDLYFTVMDVFGRAMQLLRNGNEEVPVATTHPPSAMRRELMREMFQQAYSPDTAKSGLVMATGLQDLVEFLWQLARPAVLHARETGVRPSPVWR